MRMKKRLLPPLGALLAFEAAARRGSFTRAGEELGLAVTFARDGAQRHREMMRRAVFPSSLDASLAPPVDVLAGMVTLRVHLDPVPPKRH